jgi:hypothetical protein
MARALLECGASSAALRGEGIAWVQQLGSSDGRGRNYEFRNSKTESGTQSPALRRLSIC